MSLNAPRIAAVHDLSGIGRCSLSIVLPILSAMGCWCSPLPTACLSASTIYPPSRHFVVRDLTDEMESAIAHWQELGASFDAIYSGFVGSLRQIGTVREFITRFRGKNTLVMVDPVMADHGRTYRTYSPEMCREMTALTELADIITPNLTEAAILLGEPPDRVPESGEELRTWLERLSLGGKRSVILTGVRPAPHSLGAACRNRDSGEIFLHSVREVPAQFPGTGDLFASVVLGALLQGRSLERASALAVEFTGMCVRSTLELGLPIRQGVQFEPLLKELIR